MVGGPGRSRAFAPPERLASSPWPQVDLVAADEVCEIYVSEIGVK